MGDLRVHRGREVERWVRNNPDKPLTIEEVNDGIGGWTVTSISSCLGRMVIEYPNMQRIRRGVYRWNTTPIVEDVQEELKLEPTLVFLHLEVLTKQGETILCRSDVGKLYKVTEFNL